MIPWTEKYRPKRVSEVVGNKEAVESFLSWAKQWSAGKPSKKAALLYGPAGVGKTSLVLAYANENGLDVVEVNASDFRTAEKVEQIVGLASQQATITGLRKRIILVDEVDGLAGKEDVGGVSALLKVITNTRVPIVLVANNPWDQRLAGLREKAQLIEFKRIHKATVVSHLKKICAAEGLKCSDEVLKEIADRSNGDLRSAINDLQAIAATGTISRETLNVLGYRLRDREIFSALAAAFNAKSVRDGRLALEGLDMDLQSFYQWVFDNTPEQISDIDALAEALERLARADMHLQRTTRLQRWGLMKYVTPLITTGVAAAKHKAPTKFAKFSFPSKIRFMSNTRNDREMRERIATKIAAKCHLSTSKAWREILPFIAFIFSHNGAKARGMAKFFDFDKSEVSYLSSGLKSSKK